MIFPSRSELASKQIRRTGRAEAVTKEGLAATLLPGRQPDQMGQRHSLRPVRPQNRAPTSSALALSAIPSTSLATPLAKPISSVPRYADTRGCRHKDARTVQRPAAKRVALTGRGATVFGSQRFRKEQCRPERRSARSINVCERMDQPWRLPAEVHVQGSARKDVVFGAARVYTFTACQGQNGNPGC